MMSPVSESLRLPPEARSPAQSRRFIARALSRWQLPSLVDTAVLLTSELVTNAVVHAQTEVDVTITRHGRQAVSVSVTDRSELAPHRSLHSADSATGRGLGILDSLAASWNVAANSHGKTVTFTLEQQ